MIIALLASTALAGGWTEPKPYITPRINGGAVVVNGEYFGQLNGGADVGVTTKYKDSPHWKSTTRLGGTGSYGIPSGSLGGDLRLGSFIGPSSKLGHLQLGPDVWYSGYGVPGAADYHLPWSPGVDLRALGLLGVSEGLAFTGEIAPGWAFNPDRVFGMVGPFHEVHSNVAVHLNAGINLTVGYFRNWYGWGTTEGLILSFGI